MTTVARVLVIAGIALAVAGGSCRGEREQAQRAEAGRIAHAIGALREAANDTKAPRILAL